MNDNTIGQSKYKLDTPCLVIDKEKLIYNIKLLQEFANSKGKNVRPHAKTHKCPNICKLQLKHGSIGISISKPSEALALAEAGIENLLITSPIVTKIKLDTFSKILKIYPETIITIDSLKNARQLNDLGQKLNLQINILIDVDAGIGRTGLNYNESLELAKETTQHLHHLKLKGIQCYGGHLQHIKNIEERLAATKTLLNKAGKLKIEIENITGLKNLIQSGSGTGTYEIDCDIDSVTEIQPGSYTVMDKEYYNIDKTVTFKPAMSLLTTVTEVTDF